MARLDYAAKSFRKTEPLLAELTMKPSEYLRRQVRFTPFPGEEVGSLISMTGPDLYLFSSDYPHPEGTRDPIGNFERSFEGLDVDEAAKQRFYEDNYRQLLGR
jgi:predicted TIM-barrel fold metal-dependent hydrolase